MFCAASALYQLGRFCESCEVLELLCTTFPANTDAETLLNRCRIRVSEQTDGNYDFQSLQDEAKKMSVPQLDHATYVGPVEIGNANNRGRGLFLTKAVNAGDLLLCEKAFTYAWLNEGTQNTSQFTIFLDFETTEAFPSGHTDLLRITAQKLKHNPSLATAFNALFHGNYQTVGAATVDGKPILDT